MTDDDDLARELLAAVREVEAAHAEVERAQNRRDAAADAVNEVRLRIRKTVTDRG
jgi:hypothetical protein